jgi:hypothetical protein
MVRVFLGKHLYCSGEDFDETVEIFRTAQEFRPFDNRFGIAPR